MAKKVKRDLTRERYEHTLSQIDVWEKRERRAVNKLRLLRNAKTRYESRRPDLIRDILMKQLRESALIAKAGKPGRHAANGAH